MENSEIFRGALPEYRKKGALIAAHRGVGGGNVPFNTMAAFEIALRQGADVIETDVIRSADGRLFAFHVGQEVNHLNRNIHLTEMTAEEIRQVRYVNGDNNVTQYPVAELDDVLENLKGRCLINLDHGWDGDWFEDMLKAVRRHGMRDQVIVKTPSEPRFLELMEQMGPDLMFMPIIGETDTVSSRIEGMNLQYVGAEVVFAKEDADVASPAYIEAQHRQGRFLWVNALLYSYQAPLSGGHTDDIAVAGNPNEGWGWLLDRKFDIIQTDWPGMLRGYMDGRH